MPVQSTYTFWCPRPLMPYLTKDFGDGQRFSHFMPITPVEDDRSFLWVLTSANYDKDGAEARITARNNEIFGQDQPIVNSQRPALIPEDVRREAATCGQTSCRCCTAAGSVRWELPAPSTDEREETMTTKRKIVVESAEAVLGLHWFVSRDFTVKDEGIEIEIITPGIRTKFDWLDPRSHDHHLVTATNYQKASTRAAPTLPGVRVGTDPA